MTSSPISPLGKLARLLRGRSRREANEGAFLIAAGVSSYRHLSKSEQLPESTADVKRIDGLFAGTLGYTRVLDEISVDVTKAAFESAVDRWLHSPHRQESDVVVIYFTGHGVTTPSGRHYLLPSDYEPDLLSTAVPTDAFAAMLEGSPVRQLLLIVDTCEAGQGAFELSSFAARVQAARAAATHLVAVAAVGAALPRQVAREGVFSRALVQAVHDRRTGGDTQPYLFLESIVELLNRALPHGQVAVASAIATGRPRFFPNPRYRPYIRPATDLETHARLRALARDTDMVAHWGPRSRGVEVEAQEGWYFTGRVAATREIIDFIRDGAGMKVVTGTPGAGKSAVLGRLVTLADPEYRRKMPPTALPPPELQPPDRSINVWIHAKGKTSDEVANEIHGVICDPDTTHFSKLGWASSTTVANELQGMSQPFTVLVDALDEATEPSLIAHALLQPLAEARHGKVIVGTRKQYLRYLGPRAEVIDLDDRRYVDVADIADYVRKRLLAEDAPEVRTVYRGNPELATIVAEAVARRAYPNYLVARIVSYSLLAANEPVNIDIQGWDEHFPTSVGAAFDEYLARFGDRETLVRDLFRALAYSEGSGLPWDDIWAAVASALSDRVYTDADIEWLLEHAAPYIIEDLEADRSVYRLYHQALTDHIRSSNASRSRMLQQRIVEVLAERGTRGWTTAHPYIRTHLATHAAAARAFDALLRDPTYILAADPARLQLALTISGVVSAEAYAYLGAAPLISARKPEESLAYLALRASQLGATALIERIAELPIVLPWRAIWCEWRRDVQHRLLLADGTIFALASGAVHDEPVIAAGLFDGRVLLWSLRSGVQMTVPLRGHDAEVTALAIHSPYVVSGDNHGVICIWTILGTTAMRKKFAAHAGVVFALAVANVAGDDVVISSGTDQTIRTFTLPAAHEAGLPVNVSAHDFAQAIVAPGGDARRLLCGMRDGALLTLDLESRAVVEIAPSDGEGDGITRVAAFEGEGGFSIAAGYESGVIKLWQQGSRGWRGRAIGEHLSAVSGLAALRFAQPVLVSGGEDGVVAMWRPGKREAIARVEAHEESSIASVVVDGRGEHATIISAGQDRTIRIWPAAAVAEAGTSEGEAHVSALALYRHETETFLVTAVKDAIVVRDAATGAERFRLEGHEDFVRSVTVADLPEGPLLISASEDRTVRFWDLAARKARRPPILRHPESVAAVTIARRKDEFLIVSACDDHLLRRWDLRTGKQIGHPMTGHQDAVTCLSGLSGGRDVIVSGSDDGSVRLWSAAKGSPIGTPLEGHKGWIKSVAAGTFGGGEVVFSADENTILAWNARTRAPLDTRHFGAHERSMTALTIVHGARGDWLLAGGFDGRVRIFAGLESDGRVMNVFAPVTAIVANGGPERVFIATTKGVLAVDLSRSWD